jgi:hypothetical protein
MTRRLVPLLAVAAGAAALLLLGVAVFGHVPYFSF